MRLIDGVDRIIDCGVNHRHVASGEWRRRLISSDGLKQSLVPLQDDVRWYCRLGCVEGQRNLPYSRWRRVDIRRYLKWQKQVARDAREKHRGIHFLFPPPPGNPSRARLPTSV